MAIEQLAKHWKYYPNNTKLRENKEAIWVDVANAMSVQLNKQLTFKQAKRLFTAAVTRRNVLRKRYGKTIGPPELVNLENALSLVMTMELES